MQEAVNSAFRAHAQDITMACTLSSRHRNKQKRVKVSKQLSTSPVLTSSLDSKHKEGKLSGEGEEEVEAPQKLDRLFPEFWESYPSLEFGNFPRGER